MRYLPIPNSLFKRNRSALFKNIPENDIAIFNSNDIMPTNADGLMPFKQNSDLFWLSGVDQEESVLLIYPGNKNKKERVILFLKETSDLIAIWEGAKLSKDQAYKVSGIKSVFWLHEFENKLEELLAKSDSIYLNKNIHSRSASNVETRDARFRKIVEKKYFNKKINEVAPIMHQLRSIKSKEEIDLIKCACNITEKGFKKILDIITPGIMEYEIEAEIISEFLKNRASGFAYSPILGSARNSCVLHYTANNQKCKDGDILLMDFGAEYANYASDMTRTVPVSGKFSKRQKNVYKSVLHVMREATKMLRPGTNFQEYNKEVGKIMEYELIKLGLITKHDVQKQDLKNPAYKKYFMHGTSHFLGLDVHDVGDFEQPLREGMVLTCEPGIYILEEKLGVRLENDILITKNGPDDLMKSIPIDPDEIESLMNR